MTIPVTNREKLGSNQDGISFRKYMMSYTSPIAGSIKTSTGSIMRTDSFGQLHTQQRQLPRVDRGVAVSTGNMLSNLGYQGLYFNNLWDLIRMLFGYGKAKEGDVGYTPFDTYRPSAIYNFNGLGDSDPFMVSRWAQRRIDNPTSPFYERKS